MTKSQVNQITLYARLEIIDDLLKSCFLLKKLSLSALQIWNRSNPALGPRSPMLIENLFIENSSTLEKLHFHMLPTINFLKIENFVKLKDLDLRFAPRFQPISEDDIFHLIENICSTLEKLSLHNFFNINDDHVKTISERFTNLNMIDLGGMSYVKVTNQSLSHLSQNLSSLEVSVMTVVEFH